MERGMTIEDMLYEMWLVALNHVKDEGERKTRARSNAHGSARNSGSYDRVRKHYLYFQEHGGTRADAQFAIACLK